MPDIAPQYAPLIEAGKTLAAVAEPKYAIEFASDFRELALTLKLVGDGIERAQVRAEEIFDHHFRRGRYAVAEFDRDQECRIGNVVAIRTAKRALIDLARVIAEMEGADA